MEEPSSRLSHVWVEARASDASESERGVGVEDVESDHMGSTGVLK